MAKKPEKYEGTGMDFLKKTVTVEVIKSSHGTSYAVIAKKDGLGLAVTPKIAPMSGMFVGIFVRVRIFKLEDWANLSNGPALFGFPEVKEKSPKHGSTEIVMIVARLPVTPHEVGHIIEENGLVEKLVAAIFKRTADAKVETDITEAMLVEYMKNLFNDTLPTAKPAQLVAEDFKVTFDPETYEHFKALKEKYKLSGVSMVSDEPPGSEEESGDHNPTE